MNRNRKMKLKKGDFYIILIVVCFSLSLIIIPKIFTIADTNIHKIAVIKQNDKIIKEIDLDKIEEPERFVISGDYTAVILIEKGRIRFEESTCPDKICVKTGWLEKPGDTAVCLPGRLIISIAGEKKDVDGVSY